mgnify:CR=1 FL=1
MAIHQSTDKSQRRGAHEKNKLEHDRHHVRRKSVSGNRHLHSSDRRVLPRHQQYFKTTALRRGIQHFVLILIRFRSHLTHPENFVELANDLKAVKKAGGKTTLDRLTELKELHDKNLISQVEYERKKDEIMNEL